MNEMYCGSGWNHSVWAQREKSVWPKLSLIKKAFVSENVRYFIPRFHSIGQNGASPKALEENKHKVNFVSRTATMCVWASPRNEETLIFSSTMSSFVVLNSSSNVLNIQFYFQPNSYLFAHFSFYNYCYFYLWNLLKKMLIAAINMHINIIIGPHSVWSMFVIHINGM